MMPAATFADNYTVTVDFDKKVIYVDSLNLPKSYRAIGILKILPELLERPGLTLTSNYDIQIDDMSLSDASDVALNQLRLDAIEKIEISESPVSTFQHNGQGGSINIILRKTPFKPDSKVWGNASVDYEYETDVTPFAQLCYKNNKFFMTGLLMGEYYKYTTHTETYQNASNYNNNDQTEDFRNQLARLYMEYQPSSKDKLMLNLSEVTSRTFYDHDEYSLEDGKETHKTPFDKQTVTTLRALGRYNHSFNAQSEFLAESQFVYEPGNREWFYDDIYDQIQNYHSNSFSLKMEYTVGLLPLSSPNIMKLLLGFTSTCTWKPTYYSYYEKDFRFLDYNGNDNTYHVMPYINLEMTFGKLRFKAVGEYQFYRNDMELERLGFTEESKYIRDRNDFTGKLMLCYQFQPHKHLRLIFDRRIQRPSFLQIYPYENYNLDNDVYIKGNTALKPMTSHEVSLDYIADYNWSGHKLTFNAGASYNYLTDIINTLLVIPVSPAEGSIGLSQQYLTYVNSGHNNIVSGVLMALYSYKWFSCSLTGNVFNNDISRSEGNNHYTYYNLSLMPSVHFNNGWMAAVNLTYYSKLTTATDITDASLVAHFNIGKDFGNWNIHLTGEASLTGKGHQSISGISITYPMVRNFFGGGIIYRF